MTSHRHPFRVVRAAAAAACLWFVFAADAPAQSLGDVAREEAARRNKVAAGGKAYTNANLEPAPPPAVAAPASAPAGQTATPAAKGVAAGQAPSGAAPAAGTSAAKGDKKGEPDKKDEKYWRERLKTTREAKARAESFAEALQSRINALSTDFVNRDDPAQRSVIAADRQKALDELARVKKEVQDHTKALADLQTEARREGVPPGWVR